MTEIVTMADYHAWLAEQETRRATKAEVAAADADYRALFPPPWAALAPSAQSIELDPRWDWARVGIIGGPDHWVKAGCKHLEVVPVKTLIGDVTVAQLCTTCNRQFQAPDPDWRL